MSNTYALIMAGGAGTRLWPLSRREHPKPLIKLVEDERSMFQIAVERLMPTFPPENILVVANRQLTPLLQAQAPRLPADNFIIEPMGRDTAPAVGLGAIHVRHRHPDGVMAVLTADHHIADVGKFRHILGVAAQVASRHDAVVTLGIKPDYASTGFGYIERGDRAHTLDEVDVYHLQEFREKPDQATAERYLASGSYSWNSGMFIWRAARVMDEFARHAPAIHDDLEKIASAIGTERYQDVLSDVWPTIKKTSVDYALMEHIERDVYVIPVEMGWNDIGDFKALYNVLAEDDDANVLHGEKQPLLLDTQGALIYSNRLVAVIGLEDVVVVETDDAILVCHRDRAQDVKQLVTQLKEEKRDRYL